MEIWKFWKETNQQPWGYRYYEVSNLGNVRINNNIMPLRIDKKGYLKYGSFSIHRLVAELFIPNPENKPCVDHIDTDKHNNRVDNLRWVTYKENNNNTITKQHMSDAQKGRKLSVEKCNKRKGRIPWNKGKKGMYSEETKNKLRKARLGKKLSEETIKKIVKSRAGYKHSEETKQKIRESNIKTYIKNHLQ